MRKLILPLAAAGTALAVATPAAAQYYPQPQPQPYGYGYGTQPYVDNDDMVNVPASNSAATALSKRTTPTLLIHNDADSEWPPAWCWCH